MASLAKSCGKIFSVDLGEDGVDRRTLIDVGKRFDEGRDQKLPAITEPMWILRTVTEDLPEQTFRILPGGIKTMGRAIGADFIIEAALISRVHCRLAIAPSGDLEVRDLASTNGTFVNDERVEVAHLKPGDRLRIGRVELVALHEQD